MATLLKLPHLNASRTADHGRCQTLLATRFAFWRALEIRQVTDLLQREFPAADVRAAINFARVVVSPSEGSEMLAQYVRGILCRDGARLAA